MPHSDPLKKVEYSDSKHDIKTWRINCLIFIGKELTNKDLIGLLLLFGPLEFFLAIIIGAGITPGYHTGVYYVSSLGVGETALLFNISVMILGGCLVLASYFVQKEYEKTLFSVLIFLSGFCALGVGVFPENSRPLHGIFTAFVFLFGALFLMSSITVKRTPILYITTIIGSLMLIMSFVFLPYLGLDVESTAQFMGFMKGTLERFIIYPTLIGVILLAGYLSRET